MAKRKIDQADILEILTLESEIPYLSKSGLREKLSEIMDENGEPKIKCLSHIGEIIHRKRKGLKNLDETEMIYDEIFCTDYSEEELERALQTYKDFVKEHEIEFPDCAGRIDDTFEKYVKRMFLHGLANRETIGKDSKKLGILSGEKHSDFSNSDFNFNESDENGRKKNNNTEKIPEIVNTNLYPDKNFIGRDQYCEKIHSKIMDDKTVILYGIGGIGKTELAIYYAKLHEKEYDNIIKMDFGEIIPSFHSAVANISFKNLDDKEWLEEQKFSYKRDFLLRSTEKILIIFDNVDEESIDTKIFDELCEKSEIHKIVTTRLKDKFSRYNPISVGPLEYSEQIELFKKKLVYVPEKSELILLDEILKKIDGHTKMIDIISGCINGDWSFEDALNYLNGADVDSDDIVVSRLRSIYKTDRLDDCEKRVIFYLYLFPEEGVSGTLLKKYIIPKNFKHIISLVEKGWVENKNNRIFIHPIIRDMLRAENNIEYNSYIDLFNAIITVTDNEISKNYADDLCRICNSFITTIDFTKSLNNEILLKLLKLSDFCFEHYKYMFACNICECTLRLCEKSSGKITDKSMANLHTKAGKVYQRLADYDSSIEQFKRAIKHQPEGTVELGKSYRKLGEVYRKAGKYEEALEYDNKALNLLTDDIDKAEALNAIGVVYLNMGNKSKSDPKKQIDNYKKAEEFYKKALKLREKIHASKGEIAFSYHNLGSVYYNLGNYIEAINYHLKGLEIREENQLNQTDIASSYAWLGNDYIGLKNYDVAKKMIDKSLQIRENVLGKNHPDYAWGLFSLFSWYKSTNDVLSAQKVIDEIISIRIQTLGENHEYTRQAIKEKEILLSKCLA